MLNKSISNIKGFLGYLTQNIRAAYKMAVHVLNIPSYAPIVD